MHAVRGVASTIYIKTPENMILSILVIDLKLAASLKIIPLDGLRDIRNNFNHEVLRYFHSHAVVDSIHPGWCMRR